MSSNKSSVFIIAALLVLNIVLLFKLFFNNDRTPAPVEKTASASTIENTEEAKLLRGRILLQSKYGSPLNVSAETKVSDSTGKILNIQSVITDKKLVLFFTNRHCTACIDEIMVALNELARKIDVNKIVILGDIENIIDLKIFRRKYETPIAIYKMSEKDINTPALEMGVPFIFILDKDLKASDITFVEKQLPIVTKDFMNNYSIIFSN